MRYIYYRDFSHKYLPIANKQNENRVSDIYTKIRFSTFILTFKIHHTRKANCDDIEYKNLIKNVKILKQMSVNPKYKNQIFYYKNMFNDPMVYDTLKVPEKYCPKLKDKSVEILKYFNQELEKNYKEK